MANEIIFAEKGKILELRNGSHLYGINTPESDTDYTGVFLPPIEYILGMQRVEQVDDSLIAKDATGRNTAEAIDRVLYSFQKFVKLALQNNPNILCTLFVTPENLVFKNEAGQRLLDMRYKMLHKGLKKRFVAYAHSQKHKMIIRSDKYFELSNCLEFLESQPQEEGKYLVEYKGKDYPFMKFNKGHHVQIGDLNFPVSVTVARAISDIRKRIESATNRKTLVRKFGFDTKFASHLIHLMLLGNELIKTGNLVYPVKWKDTILDIKAGKWKITEVLEYADELEEIVNINFRKTELPEKAAFKEVEEYVIKELKDWINA